MTSKDRGKVEAFIDYANDSEGMRFTLSVAHAHGGKPARYSARPASGTNYAPEVIHAVQRNFKSDFG